MLKRLDPFYIVTYYINWSRLLGHTVYIRRERIEVNLAPCKIYVLKRKAAKKFFFVARPLRPYSTLPSSLLAKFFGKFFLPIRKSNFFLVARPLPHPLLVAGPLIKELFFRLPLLYKKIYEHQQTLPLIGPVPNFGWSR